MKTTANNNMALEQEMELWEARANDEFGTILKQIEKTAFSEMFNEEDEYGITSTPISYHIAAYSLDGNRKHTAKVISAIVENYDMMGDENVKSLVCKMNEIANPMASDRRKVFVARVCGVDAPLGGYANFYNTKEEAKAEIDRYIKAGRITKGYVETAYLEY